MEFRDHYFDDPAAKAAFERYAQAVFGLDFTRWKSRGLWDPAYVPFSAFDGDTCAATICIYPSEMRVDRRPMRAAQLLTVGTLPEYRSQGLHRELWTRARAWWKRSCDFAFLFTHEDAAGFYERLGFRRRDEVSEVIDAPHPAGNGAPALRKLDIDGDEDFEIVKALALEREMTSHRLGFRNPSLQLFMYLYAYRDRTFFSEALEAVIVIERRDTRIRIHDLMARTLPRTEDLLAALGAIEGDEIEFLFCTDRFDLDDHAVRKDRITDGVLFVTEEFPLEGDFLFPAAIGA